MFFEAAKPYMNVELYKYEQELKDREGKKEPIAGQNSIYEEMVKVGRATGRFWIPDSLRKGLEEFNKKAKSRTMDPNKPLAAQPQLPQIVQIDQEEDELG